VPIVPYNADLGYQRDTASTKPREESYGVEAAALQTFTKGAMAFGGVVADIDNKIKADRESVYKEQASAEARKSSTENIGKVLVDPNTAPDGSNFFEQYTKFNEESKKQFINKVPEADEYLKSKLDTHMNNVMSQSYDTALKTRIEYQKDSGEKLRLDQQNQMTSDVYQKPYDAMPRFETYAKSIEESPTMAPYAKVQATYIARKKAASAAINGFLDGKQYGEAQDILNKFPQAFDETEAASKRKEIEERRYNDIRIQNQQDDSDVKRTHQQIKAVQTKNFTKYLGDADQLQDITAPNYAASLDQKMKGVDRDKSVGLLSLDQATILTAIYKNEKVQTDPNVHLDLQTQLIKKQDLDQMEGKISAAVGNHQISGSEASVLLKELQSTKSQLGPRMELSDTDKLVSSLVDTIEPTIRGPFMKFSFDKAKDDATAAAVKAQFYENRKNPAFRGNPRAALNAALDQYHVPVYPVGVPPANGANATEKMQDIENRYKSGQISDKVRLQYLKALKIEQSRENGLRARKDGK
jgi:hypothetical protein